MALRLQQIVLCSKAIPRPVRCVRQQAVGVQSGSARNILSLSEIETTDQQPPCCSVH